MVVAAATITPAAVATLAAAAPPTALAATSAPTAAATVAIAPGQGPALLARLRGQRARVVDNHLVIDDIAGEGRPWIGVVERRGLALWLVGAQFAAELVGPLARPRLAGPGYTVWVTGALRIGDRAGSDVRLVVRRLGVLVPPAVR